MRGRIYKERKGGERGGEHSRGEGREESIGRKSRGKEEPGGVEERREERWRGGEGRRRK